VLAVPADGEEGEEVKKWKRGHHQIARRTGLSIGIVHVILKAADEGTLALLALETESDNERRALAAAAVCSDADCLDRPARFHSGHQGVLAAAGVGVMDVEQGPPQETREVSRCTGHCCRWFTLGASPPELGNRLRLARAISSEFPPIFADLDLGASPEDLETISECFTYGGYSKDPPDDIGMEHSAEPAHWYGCHKLQDNGDCGIYDRRPQLCRRFPAWEAVGGRCQNPACTRAVEVKCRCGAWVPWVSHGMCEGCVEALVKHGG
jgi:Fe-S-cluster containining protein